MAMKGRWRKDKRTQGAAGPSSSSSCSSSSSSSCSSFSSSSFSSCSPSASASGQPSSAEGRSSARLWASGGNATETNVSRENGVSAASADQSAVDTAGFFSRQRLAKEQAEGKNKGPQNAGALIACRAMKQSEYVLCDSSSFLGFKKALEGGSIYLPSFCCEKDDFSIFNNLLRDLQNYAEQVGSSADTAAPRPNSSSSPPAASSSSRPMPFVGAVNWSRHLKHENPSFSPTFRRVVAQLSSYFDVEVYATRLNLYMDGGDWKPFHKDSHAYSQVTHLQEDITVGASFGASRALEFVHDSSDSVRFSFPQHNGDVFAFCSEVNKAFKHGVPAAPGTTLSPRFSVILWGRRRTLNERNAGASELERENRGRL
ncbi:hypothetical protein TGMAS_204390 [Toxoplasma gondii MAS]|uniref:2OG-Fe(II) oxygenase family protein n=2 Tax=Toxoplasma gondii TaxID=5811 RepID=A0A086PNY1_TOXGO|nr:hypothetical protein TGMAS_204390 [Toxoplasma gondii MAS]PUA89268.1 hypothetical protein TGBR9_204390 [Toxoplasma gondii TgCATBr9]